MGFPEARMREQIAALLDELADESATVRQRALERANPFLRNTLLAQRWQRIAWEEKRARGLK